MLRIIWRLIEIMAREVRYMENIKNAINTAENLEVKYELPCDSIKDVRASFDDFKVYVPLVGRFSAGKSALINNILGWGMEVCKEDIGVATAIPTEVFAGESDKACICHPDKEYITMEQYMEVREQITTKNAEVVKLQLSNNEALNRFPSVALVDMPGLNSGYELHDEAIEKYLKKSMSFILVFAADELKIPESMEQILSDLNSYNMPMCVVITKGNRISGCEDIRISELRKDLNNYFGEKEYPVFVTETETGEVGELISYLESLDSKADMLAREFYRKKLEPEFVRITNYLMGYLKNMELTLSELEEEKDRINFDINKLNDTVDKELTEFDNQITKLVNDIAMDVQVALSNQMEEYVSDLIHDTDVSNAINETVRKTLISSYQTRVMAKLQKQLDKIANAMVIGSTNYASSLVIDMDKICGKEISGIGRTAIDVIALILGPLGPIVAHLLTGLINKNISAKRREAESKVKQQLSSSVFPAVDKEVRDKVELDLKHVAFEVREQVEKDINTQMKSLQKALQEVIAKKEKEDLDKEKEKAGVEEDLKQVDDIRKLLMIGQ